MASIVIIDNQLGGGSNLPPQPFLLNAAEYHQLKIPIIPCDGKRPLVPWKQYQSEPIADDTIITWSRQFPNANIGIIAGTASNLTIVDCDNPELSIQELEDEFGISNFIVATPSGGKHLYYKHSGEASGIIRAKIDIKAQGGLIIAPYSFNNVKNRYYQIIRGCLSDLNNLTSLYEAKTNKKGGSDSDLFIQEGERNKYLFDELRKVANNCNNYQELEELAFNINCFRFTKPLDNPEVINTTKSVWSYKVKGNLYTKHDNQKKVIEALIDNKSAFWFLEFLKINHNNQSKYFCIDQVQTAKRIGCDSKTLKKYIEVLMANKLLFKKRKIYKKNVKNGKIKTEAYQYSLTPYNKPS